MIYGIRKTLHVPTLTPHTLNIDSTWVVCSKTTPHTRSGPGKRCKNKTKPKS
jgi:hypothetical protein